MYRNYNKITTTEEAGLIDFIGDYLLHGKEIFGHNEHDKLPVKGNEVQFQHQANPWNVELLKLCIVIFPLTEISSTCPQIKEKNKTSGYLNELFRPPLAWVRLQSNYSFIVLTTFLASTAKGESRLLFYEKNIIIRILDAAFLRGNCTNFF